MCVSIVFSEHSGFCPVNIPGCVQPWWLMLQITKQNWCLSFMDFYKIMRKGNVFLTHQAWGLVLACLERDDHWGSHYIHSTGTSSAPPAGCPDWAPDPSERRAMSQRRMCQPDRPLPSPESLGGTGRQIAWIFVWASKPSGEVACEVTFKECGKMQALI